MQFFDLYSFKARLLPALLAVSPIFICIFALGYDLEISKNNFLWFILLSIFLFSQQSIRGLGKKLEKSLFVKWGGKPSVVMLRHRDSFLNSEVKLRYHLFLNKTITDLQLASPTEEEQDPLNADSGYESASHWLIANTRDIKKFPLIFSENVNYGFRRNLLAAKPYALFLDAVIFIGVVFFLAYKIYINNYNFIIETSNIPYLLTLAFVILHFLCYIIIVKSEWVHEVSKEYAKQLLSACDKLNNNWNL